MYNSNGDEKSNDIGLLELDHKIDIHDTHTLMFQIFTKQIEPFVVDFDEMQDYLDITYKSVHFDINSHFHEGEST